jgi:hypothetical protein
VKALPQPARRLQGVLILTILVVGSLLAAKTPVQQGRAASAPPCETPGWFPSEFGLKDHHIFWHGGYYYLLSNYLPSNSLSPKEDRFVYARSADLCHWEQLESVLPERTPGAWDEKFIWAPFVYREDGTYYLYYTGVTESYTQHILLATTLDPSEPASWAKQEMAFRPDHAGMLWAEGAWADCRDPTLIKVGDLYYLYYAGRDQAGGIIGAAVAPSVLGPWSDLGSVIPPIPNGMPESPAVVHYAGRFYLFYNLSRVGGYYRIGESPLGPWGAALPFRPGWAHEVWQDVNGEWLTSYLTVYAVSIDSLTWDAFFNPPRPFIGQIQSRLALPTVFRP